MKVVPKLLAMLLVLGLVGMVQAKEKANKADVVRGTVDHVDGKNVVIKSGHKDAQKEITVATDDNTKVTIDGKEAKLSDLQAGQHVTVSPATGTAVTIEVRAAHNRKAAK